MLYVGSCGAAAFQLELQAVLPHFEGNGIAGSGRAPWRMPGDGIGTYRKLHPWAKLKNQVEGRIFRAKSRGWQCNIIRRV
jgi:hypothetical protein